MKFSCSQPDLAHALKLCAPVSTDNQYDPTMKNVEILAASHRIKLSAANKSSAISTWVTAEVTEGEGETIALACRGLYEFIRRGSGTVSLYPKKGGKRSIVKRSSGGRGEFAHGGSPPEMIPDELSGTPIQLRGRDLLPVLAAASMAGDKDPSKSLNAIWLSIDGGYIRSAATDGFRAAYIWALIDSETARGSFLLHHKTARDLRRMLSVNDTINVYQLGKRLVFDAGTSVFAASQFANDNPPHKVVTEWATQPIEDHFDVDLYDFRREMETCVPMFEGAKIKSRIALSVDPENHLLDIETSKENPIGHLNLSLLAKNIAGGAFSFLIDAAYVKEALDAMDLLDDAKIATEYETPVNDVTIGRTEEGRMISVTKRGVNAVFLIAAMKEVK